MKTSTKRRAKTLHVFAMPINIMDYIKWLQEQGLAKLGGEARRLSNQRIPISQHGTATNYIGVSAKPQDLSKTWIWETESDESIRDAHTDDTRHVTKRGNATKRLGRKPGRFLTEYDASRTARPASEAASSSGGESDGDKGAAGGTPVSDA